MSFNDDTPTQYHGNDGYTFVRPGDGKCITVTPERALALVKAGAVEDDAWINLRVTRTEGGFKIERKFFIESFPPLARAQDSTPIDTGHRDGCAFGRTARCTCTYLAQWDRTPDYTAPTWDQNAPLRPLGSRNKEDNR